MGQFKIVSGNILNYINECDVVVNSTNEYMISGSGVCGLIYKIAGKEKLENYCKKNYNQKMITNEVRITPGFDLNADIINIFAPKYYEQKEPFSILIDSYKKIFEAAAFNNYKNILTVSIGTGIHGYKHNEVAKIIISNINELVFKYDINLIMVLPTDLIEDLYKKYLN